MADGTDHESKAAGERLSWVLVALLAVIVVIFFLLDGAAQSTAITVALIAGLAAIAWAGATRRERG